MIKKKNKELAKFRDDLIPRQKLDLWIKNKYNVLFKGRHGVGKTHIILSAFKRAGLRYAYFSGATMDPFIDFVGIPVKVVNSKTGKSSIKLIRPEHLVKLDAQAFFFDEFNRTHKKIRNAVMELMQFKTINGTPISSDLQMIWAAVNPDDDEGEYDVDRLDPAQADRFHIQVDIPFKCSLHYFMRKFGKEGKTAVQFWNKLDKVIQDQVSPRRLEYVMQLYKDGGDIRDALPIAANPSRLVQLLTGNGYQELEPLLENEEEAEAFFKVENNYSLYIGDVLSEPKLHPLFDMMPDEKIAALLNGPKQKAKILAKHIWNSLKKGEGDLYKPILKEIVEAKSNWPMVNWATKVLSKANALIKQKKVKVTAKQVGNAAKTASTRTVLVQLFSAVVNTKKFVTALDIKNEIFKQIGRRSSTKTIETKVLRLTPWLKARHKLKIKKEPVKGWAWSATK